MKTNLEMAKECGAEIEVFQPTPNTEHVAVQVIFIEQELDAYTAAAIAQATEQLQSEQIDKIQKLQADLTSLCG